MTLWQEHACQSKPAQWAKGTLKVLLTYSSVIRQGGNTGTHAKLKNPEVMEYIANLRAVGRT